jgi:hypothetical protein
MSRLFPTVLCALLLPLAGCDAIVEPDEVAPPPRSATPGALRCPHCGWIEARQEILPLVADPRALQVFEYTVRMADGSSRVFQETLPASWRLRERLVVIDGSAPHL